MGSKTKGTREGNLYGKRKSKRSRFQIDAQQGKNELWLEGL